MVEDMREYLQNVNMGAILCCMAIGMSLILFQNANKIKKSFLLINIILQIMFIRLALSAPVLL